MILNTHRQYPRDVIIGSEKAKKYPSNADIIDILDQLARRTISMDFNELSKARLNDSIYANVIILGVGVKEYKEVFDKKIIIQILKEFFERDNNNIEAFDIGYNLIS